MEGKINKLIFIFILYSFTLIAGNKTGNGGFVVQCYGENQFNLNHTEVLDIAEAKLKGNRLHSLSIFNSVEDNIKDLFEEVSKKDFILSLKLKQIYLNFKQKFVLVDSLDEFKINDVNESPIPFASFCFLKLAIVQAKIDNTRLYFVKRDVWQSLSNIQKAYLILHEIYYTHLLLVYGVVPNSDSVRLFVSNL